MAAFHFFVFVWTHHHHMADLTGYVRHLYPGMPRDWYTWYARDLVRDYGTGRDLIIAVSP